MKRRAFISAAIATGGFAGVTSSFSSCGNKDSAMATKAAGGKIKIGFIPLTDCASVVMAHELGLYKKHGLDVDVSREASWATVRDKVLSGDLDGAHCLFGMPFSVYAGVGGIAGQEMLIAIAGEVDPAKQIRVDYEEVRREARERGYPNRLRLKPN